MFAKNTNPNRSLFATMRTYKCDDCGSVRTTCLPYPKCDARGRLVQTGHRERVRLTCGGTVKVVAS